MTLKAGDRVVYTGTLSPLHRGRSGTVVKISPTRNVQIAWDDGLTPLFTPASDNVTKIEPVPNKRPSEVILEKLIEAKREQRVTNLAYDKAQQAASEATERVATLERQLNAAIRAEAEKK